MNDGVFLTTSTLSALSPTVRAAILEALMSDASVEQTGPGGPESDELAVLSDRQARKLIESLHPKTLSVLEAIADLGPRFTYPDLLDRVNVPQDQHRSLAGVWAGLTKRTRSICNDPGVKLIVWSGGAVDVSDSRGEMHPGTHQALRRVLQK